MGGGVSYLKRASYQKEQNKYDFLGQSYASMYPNLHRYPATMLPQIGIELLKDFKVKKTNLYYD